MGVKMEEFLEDSRPIPACTRLGGSIFSLAISARQQGTSSNKKAHKQRLVCYFLASRSLMLMARRAHLVTCVTRGA